MRTMGPNSVRYWMTVSYPPDAAPAVWAKAGVMKMAVLPMCAEPALVADGAL